MDPKSIHNHRSVREESLHRSWFSLRKAEGNLITYVRSSGRERGREGAREGRLDESRAAVLVGLQNKQFKLFIASPYEGDSQKMILNGI
jgi:hypothetical protein